MSKGAQLTLSRTRTIAKPNLYIVALKDEFSPWAFDEERVLEHKGRWREHLGVGPEAFLDLEIGTGNGTHFAHYAAQNPGRNIVGLELKYKPLIQTIRRALRLGCTNARVARYNAVQVQDLFVTNELNNVLIHFPDPWVRLRQNKHRLIQTPFLDRLHTLQRPGSEIEFKTDSEDYFDWAMAAFEKSEYKQIAYSRNLHQSEWAAQNFSTQFESLFLRQGLPIYFAKFCKE